MKLLHAFLRIIDLFLVTSISLKLMMPGVLMNYGENLVFHFPRKDLPDQRVLYSFHISDSTPIYLQYLLLLLLDDEFGQSFFKKNIYIIKY